MSSRPSVGRRGRCGEREAAQARLFLALFAVFSLLVCVPHAAAQVCGNNAVEGTEECDNANGRGCATNCLRDTNYYCAGSPSTCTQSFPISLTGSGTMTLSGATAVDTTALRTAIATAAGNSVAASDVTLGTPVSTGTGWSVPFTISFAQTNAGVVPSVGANLNPISLAGARVTNVVFNNNCGNQQVELGEACEFNGLFNDGCSTTCTASSGYVCRANLVSTTVSGVTTQRIVCTLCSNGIVNAATSAQVATEACDDGNVNPGDGCGRECRVETGYTCATNAFGLSVCSIASTVCGNGVVQTGEGCDDGNLISGDGCSAGCAVEAGYVCTVNSAGRSVCALNTGTCGNGVVQTGEGCDDGNLIAGDGCSAACTVEAGYVCVVNTASRSVCSLTGSCGNGVVQTGEACDDGNLIAGDGCSAACTIESGYVCSLTPTGRSVCAISTVVCGNGVLQSGEGCDDGNLISLDGCSSACTIESGYTCTSVLGSRSVCSLISTGVCGNGVINTGEACDDGNAVSGDGCSSVCAIESGFTCTTVLSKSVCSLSSITWPTPFDGDDDDSDDLWWVILLCILAALCLLFLLWLLCCRRKKPKAPPMAYAAEPVPVVPLEPKPAPLYVHPPPQISPAVMYEVYDTY